eukprot:TRINITY_DN11831_c0_g1::TRINITY_DN11831_c0_g1_i1::g.16442::m.16442 TRINITY_DN11831_c0_g1::TRINITY_DN11831_c0_g1_i1::g.16442  ORF type:complete len:520 (-),score=199.94,sp/P31023/DLDH_PEA/61.19/0.0,Pyr_redox_2/PF07992.9/9e-46,Pyr_redox_dim/PF02852.17/4e+03,Pyr_redox_dim/PF02852.17/5.1e-41,Pyr_redox/PF00070.22/0.36,Pyr_redox/PF00070.22/1.8e+03,Pyr_redox/PF00070.22/4e-19,FAD_oxidored/PF12831.2/3.6e-10,FAD_oxidored/PF12831.2/7.7e+02,FAD_oxidored/PF12831.2/4.7e+02,GIDA/PF01134.17/2.6e-07,GIDA/PF01134.
MSLRALSTAAEKDLVVVGGGPGGYVAAIKAGQMGLKVACVEKRGTLGGTCLNVGCIPSKALLHASHYYHAAKHDFAKYGIKVDNVQMDVAQMMKQKEKAVTGLTKGIEALFKKNGVEYVKGTGKLTGKNEISVDGLDGKKTTIKTKNILLATGSDISSVPGTTIKIDEEKIISSTGALALKSIPQSLVVIGGGVIGLEMGSVWSRLGSKVTVIEYLDSIGSGMDGEIAKSFQTILKKQGFDFRLKQQVLGAEVQSNGKVKVTYKAVGGGNPESVEADVVLVSTGRRPYTDNLGLEAVGIKKDKRGFIEIDDHFRTNVPNVYAIGDIVRGPMLAHKAEEEGIAVVENLVLPNQPGHVNYNAIPGVVYTHPEVAWVGKTEEEVKKSGVAYRIGKFPFMANSRARTNDDAEGMVKIIAEKETDKVLGVHMIGPNVGELIAEAVLTIEYGGSSEDIARTCHAHPTLSEALKEAALATYDKPIHF